MGAGTSWREWLVGVATGESTGAAGSLVGAVLAPLAWIYQIGLRTYLWPYRTGLRRQFTLSCPVISVGNLSVGGTGKSAATATLARRLLAQGRRPCILSRGYRGAGENVAAVVSTREAVLLGSEEAGDEAYMLASALPGVPVLVGRDRRTTGKLAMQLFAPDVIVLDDGMQYYQLRRDVDIAMLDSLRPFGNGWVLPRGLLREPPDHLRRCTCAILNGVDRLTAEQLVRARGLVGSVAPGLPLFEGRYAPREVVTYPDGPVLLPTQMAGRQVATACALGNPAGFEATVAAMGATIADYTRWPDHYRPSGTEIHTVSTRAKERGADCLLVTEKDAAKLGRVETAVPILVLRTEYVISDGDALMALIQDACTGAGRRC